MMRKTIIGLLLVWGLAGSVLAQPGQPVIPLVAGAPVSNANPMPVSASVSASVTGFPGASPTTGTPISVTTGGVTGTLPAGTVVVASNVGTTNIAYCKLGASATTADQPVTPNGGWFAFTVGAATQLTCITSTSTTTVNMVGGSGLPTGTGGGGGGSGGGGAITIASGAVSSGAYSAGSIASGAMVDLGAIADAASTAGGTGTLSAKLRLMTTQLGTINTTLGTPLQAGGTVVVTGVSTAANQTSVIGTKAPGTAAANSMLNGGVYTAAGVTLTDGQQAALQFTAAGAAHVNVDNATAAITPTDALANPTTAVPVLGFGMVWDSVGTQWVRQAGTTAGTKITAASGSLASGAVVDITNVSTPITPTTATATKGFLLGGQYNSTQATFTNGQQGALQFSSRGEAKTNIMDAAGNARGANVDANNNMGVVLPAETTKVIGTTRIAAMAAAARNAPGCTVGTSSAQCLAAAQAVNFLQIQNVNATSTNYVACNIVGGTAVLNSATSILLAPGQSASWGPNTGGVPSGAINCIATSASSPLYVEWN